MKLQITLSLIFTTLFFNNVYAQSAESTACKLALDKGDVPAALVQANKAVNNNSQDKDALICHGRALAANDDLAAALAAFKLADAQSVDAFDKTVVSMLIGNTHKALKQYDQAIASYSIASTQAKASKTVAYERVSYNAIGNIQALNQQYALALAQYTLASQLAANDNERGESYENIALMHHKMNQPDLAVEYQLKGYVMQSKSGSLDEHAHAGIELGRYYGLNKNYASATNILNKMIGFAIDNGGAYYEAKASCVLASVKKAEGNQTAANALIEKAKLIAKNTRDTALENEIQQELQGL